MPTDLPTDERDRRRHWYQCIFRGMDAQSHDAGARLHVEVTTPAEAGERTSSPTTSEVIYRYMAPPPDTPTLNESLKRRPRPNRKLWVIATLLLGLALAVGIIVKLVAIDGSPAASTSAETTGDSSKVESTQSGQNKNREQADEARSNGLGSRGDGTGASRSGDLEDAVKAWTPPSRVRRSWKSYTDDEKKLYLNAVQLGMQKGYHYRFTEVHTARLNKLTSHGPCAFLLWHRRFILGYENMLRSLAPEFSNLTLPYWNYFEDTNRQLSVTTKCDSLESCSQFLRDMGGGGTSDGPTGQTLTIGPVEVRIGSCVSTGIAGHACDHPNGTASGLCHNCVMRGNWSNPRKIVEALGPDLLSVLNVFNASQEAEEFEGAHAVLSHRIENSFHNAIHNTLNSTMRFTSSAFDPIFIGHHGMVDLAQFIMNRCKYVPDASVTIDWTHDVRSSRFDVFTQCDVEDEDGLVIHTVKGDDAMQMTMYDIPVEEEQLMKRFFSGFGNKYKDIANVEDLGPTNSYTYLIDPYLQQLLASHNVQCPDYLYTKNRTTSARRLAEQTEPDFDQDPDRDAAISLARALASCGAEIQATYPDVSYEQRLENEGLVKCLAIEHRSGGELHDYDAEFRLMMRIPSADSTYCASLLRRYRQGQLRILASDNCLRRYGDLVGVDMLHLANR